MYSKIYQNRYSKVINNNSFNIKDITLTAKDNDRKTAQTEQGQKANIVNTHLKENTSGQSKKVTKDVKLTNLLAGSNIVISPAEVYCHRKAN